ncbi:FG-GAP and VCBS repeat-containing protein [Streptomyces sp. ODS28]|uniref:FG-GAP and VCBS repeat-containing protein n=1 Tax=Streptomyces sp. ODS28 TaxID=3136688 RepID=UPI0031EB4754
MTVAASSGVLAAGLMTAGAGPASAAGSGKSPSGKSSSPSGIRGDFNGDGYGDVATYASLKSGRVTVLYGSAQGRLGGGRADLGQHSPGVPGDDGDSDNFGSALTAGDFDEDGYSDLGVGVPGRIADGQEAFGGVTLLWGSSSGLRDGSTPDTGTPADTDPDHAVGRALAAADFDGDGHLDLATTHNEGVRVIKGPLTRAGRNAGVSDVPGLHGWSQELRAGDMNGDGRADLVAETEKAADPEWRAAAQWAAGRSTGLSSFVDVPGVPAGDGYPGSSQTALGDIDHDGKADLAAADPKSGRVAVVYGSASGPGGGRPSVTLTQDTEGVPATDEPGDKFGLGLAIGDTDGDGYGELAVGAPGETLGRGSRAVKEAGAVTVLRGTAEGVSTKDALYFTENSEGVPGHAERGDDFGTELVLADNDGDGRADLTASAIGENGHGTVWNLPSTARGVTGRGSAYFGPPAGADFFGNPLAR